MADFHTPPSRLQRITRRMAHMDLFDFINHGLALGARLRTWLLYKPTFGRIGPGSWIKKPDQIFGASRVNLGSQVRIEKGAVLYAVKRYADQPYGGRITVGDRTYMNRYFNATSAVGIDIGKEVAFGPNVFVCDFDHGYTDPNVSRIDSALSFKGPVSIGDRCWIGANVYIASGVTLGHDCVVGANSVVTRSFPPFTVIAGSPARAIRMLDRETNTWRRVEQESVRNP